MEEEFFKDKICRPCGVKTGELYITSRNYEDGLITFFNDDRTIVGYGIERSVEHEHKPDCPNWWTKERKYALAEMVEGHVKKRGELDRMKDKDFGSEWARKREEGIQKDTRKCEHQGIDFSGKVHINMDCPACLAFLQRQ